MVKSMVKRGYKKTIQYNYSVVMIVCESLPLYYIAN